MILRDDIAHHKKFLLAGQLIGGPAGPARALAVWVGAIGYARTGLTNGIVHDAFLEKFSLDSDAKLVGKILSLRRIRLFHRIKGGYLIHDFEEHNGSAEKLLRDRELAKARKRRQRAQEAAAQAAEDARCHAVTPHVTGQKPRDSRARDQRKGKGVRSTSNARGGGEGCTGLLGTFTGASISAELTPDAASLGAGSLPRETQHASLPHHDASQQVAMSVPAVVRDCDLAAHPQPADAPRPGRMDGVDQGPGGRAGEATAFVPRRVEGGPGGGTRPPEEGELQPVYPRAAAPLAALITPLKTATTPSALGHQLRQLAQKAGARR